MRLAVICFPPLVVGVMSAREDVEDEDAERWDGLS